ncbi:MAG: putative enzyme related to lactoylglutathione lyase [Planctomycetota bacterium]|jgi:predicted enzyme related to lactoylglutathione lyase
MRLFSLALPVTATLLAAVLCAWPASPTVQAEKKKSVQIQYLEFVTPDVDATCKAMEELHGVSFSDPVPEFGNARTAELRGGGLIGVRAPMRADETPIVRPYILVKDIDAAIATAKAAGAEIAMPPMDIPGRGKFAIYIQGGINYGLWQL